MLAANIVESCYDIFDARGNIKFGVLGRRLGLGQVALIEESEFPHRVKNNSCVLVPAPFVHFLHNAFRAERLRTGSGVEDVVDIKKDGDEAL